MPASKVPPPEMNTTRIYYRDENNVSKPFGWISDDHSLILLDEGEVLSRQSDDSLMNRNGVVYSRYDTSKAFRLVHWIITRFPFEEDKEISGNRGRSPLTGTAFLCLC